MQEVFFFLNVPSYPSTGLSEVKINLKLQREY